jgi:hypothetical protein
MISAGPALPTTFIPNAAGRYRSTAQNVSSAITEMAKAGIGPKNAMASMSATKEPDIRIGPSHVAEVRFVKTAHAARSSASSEKRRL